MTKPIVLGVAAAAAVMAAGVAQAHVSHAKHEHAASAAAVGGDSASGAAIFKQQCSLCHSVDPGVENAAPNLRGVVGRKAAGDPKFTAYTPAIKASKVVWKTATLDGFLSGPAKMIPGTAMPISLADPKQRHDVIAYLASVKK